VLVVHHHPLRLADPLQDHLLRRLRGDAAEVLGRDVLALDLILGDLGPVDVEVVIGEERVRALAVLGFDPLELLQRALARLVDETLLAVGRQLDRVDAKVALLVDLDGGVARRARRLLVGGKKSVLERRDQRAALDPLLALDVSDCVDDLLRHLVPTSSIRLPRTIESYGTSMDSPFVFTVPLRSPAPTTSPRTRCRPA